MLSVILVLLGSAADAADRHANRSYDRPDEEVRASVENPRIFGIGGVVRAIERGDGCLHETILPQKRWVESLGSS